MIITATEFKTNLGKYLEMAASQDIFITKNGKNIARLTSPTVNKLALLDDLVGILDIIQVVDAVAERTRFPLSPYSRFPSSKILWIFSVSSSVAASRGWAQRGSISTPLKTIAFLIVGIN